MPKTWIEFDTDVIYEIEGRNKGPSFDKGRKYELDDALAQRFINHGEAHKIDEPPELPRFSVMKEPELQKKK